MIVVGMWRIWITRVEKLLNILRGGLLGPLIRNIDDSDVESNVDCDGQTQEVSEDKNISKWPRNGSCDILKNNVAAFCLCPKISP